MLFLNFSKHLHIVFISTQFMIYKEEILECLRVQNFDLMIFIMLINLYY